ncbi:hypothetical protein CGRA01v4_14478 [Colletotrichum graminicola]|nr:hypothetical protein CGRA01v4_14478 [Colletotrichum graminicola]
MIARFSQRTHPPYSSGFENIQPKSRSAGFSPRSRIEDSPLNLYRREGVRVGCHHRTLAPHAIWAAPRLGPKIPPACAPLPGQRLKSSGKTSVPPVWN